MRQGISHKVVSFITLVSQPQNVEFGQGTVLLSLRRTVAERLVQLYPLLFLETD